MAYQSDKRKLFIEAYLDCLNATEAARRAGYATPMQEGHRLLRIDEIKEAVREGMQARAMPADEVLARLTAIASADIRDLFDFDADGNMKKLKLTRDAPLYMIKSLVPTAKGLKVELHDAQAALNTLAKHHGLLHDTNINLTLTPDELRSMSDADLERLGEQLDKTARRG